MKIEFKRDRGPHVGRVAQADNELALGGIMDRDYQELLEETIIGHGVSYEQLYNSVSNWFSADDMCKFLKDYMDWHDIDFPE